MRQHTTATRRAYIIGILLSSALPLLGQGTITEGGLEYSTVGMPAGECRVVDSPELVVGELHVPSALPNGLRVTSVGRRAFAYERGLTGITLPEGLVEIGDSAFACSGLREVRLPAGLRAVPGHCFSACPQLASALIPQSVRTIGAGAFDQCHLLEAATLPDSLTEIGNRAFHQTALSSVNVPATVTRIGDGAFAGCTALSDITLRQGLVSLGRCAFTSCHISQITLPASVQEIGQDCFEACEGLERITVLRRPNRLRGETLDIPNEVAKGLPPLGPIAMLDRAAHAEDRYIPLRGGIYYHPLGQGRCKVVGYNPKDLGPNVVVPSEVTLCGELLRVTEVGNKAFSGYTDLRRLELPHGLEVLGPYALCWTALEALTLPETLRSVGEGALTGCEELKHIRILGRTCAPEVGRGLLMVNCAIELVDQRSGATTNLQSATIGSIVYQPLSPWTCEVAGYDHDNMPTRADIPRSVAVRGRALTVEGIAPRAFADCMSLTTAHLPESVKRIGEYAFSACGSLAFVNLPEHLHRLEKGTFAGCTLLPGIELPAGLEYIGQRCFEGSGLRSVAVPATTTVVDDHAFYHCTSLRSIGLGEGLHAIGRWAFCNAPITSVTLPAALTRIGDNAFTGCSLLRELHAPGRNKPLPPEITHGLPDCCTEGLAHSR